MRPRDRRRRPRGPARRARRSLTPDQVPAHLSDEHLDAVLIGGREPVAIVISPYDPAWPVRYDALAAAVRSALGEAALQVEHIGSTSVPGLAAKPVVDALLVVADLEAEAYVLPLAPHGLAVRVREPGHRMLRTAARDVHLHVVAPGVPEIADWLDLRDWLRVSPADRALYAATKRHLAEQPWSDMNHYADAKTEVVSAVLARARGWRARQTGPSDWPAVTGPP